MYLFYSDWQGYTEENETYRLHVPMQTQQKEKSKRKRRNVFKETITNYDVPSGHVRAITSFPGFAQNKPVFRFVVTCFVLSSKILLFYWWAEILLKSILCRLGFKMWQPMVSLAATVTKDGGCSVSSVLWLIPTFVFPERFHCGTVELLMKDHLQNLKRGPFDWWLIYIIMQSSIKMWSWNNSPVSGVLLYYIKPVCLLWFCLFLFFMGFGFVFFSFLFGGHGGTFQATARFQESDFFQEAVRMCCWDVFGVDFHLSGFKLQPCSAHGLVCSGFCCCCCFLFV